MAQSSQRNAEDTGAISRVATMDVRDPVLSKDSPHILATLVASLLVLQAGLLAYTATCHSPTVLEPAQLAAGISNWQLGRFELYCVNPPLVRMIAALPVQAAGCKTNWANFYTWPGKRPEFTVGSDFIEANGKRSLWLLTIARWACIPISLAGGLFCFCWARECWGTNGAGLVALMLWCFDPNILAHAELINTDTAAASFGVGATYTFWRWLRRPTWPRVVAAGVLLGLAELSKMSWLFLFGLWPLLWLVARCVRQPSAALRSTANDRNPATPPAHSLTLAYHTPSALQLTSILVLGLYVLNLGYTFDGTMTQLGDYTFVSQTLSGTEPGEHGNCFAGTCLAPFPVPVPRQYLLGLDLQNSDFEKYSQASYLHGEWKHGGWWYFYLYALAVKMPHGTQFLLLLVAAANLIALTRTPRPCFSSERVLNVLILLTPPLVLFVLVSAQLEFNEHLRYVLPCMPFVFVYLGQTAVKRTTALTVPGPDCRCPSIQHCEVMTPSSSNDAHLGPVSCARSRSCSDRIASQPSSLPVPPAGLWGLPHMYRSTRLLVAAGIAWTLASSLSVFPHQLAYFNEFAGGAPNGHFHLLGSNLDWGQDLLYLDRWAAVHTRYQPLRLAYYGRVDPESVTNIIATPCRLETGSGAASDGATGMDLSAGWDAISLNVLKGRTHVAFGGAGGAFRTEDAMMLLLSQKRGTRPCGYSICVFPRSASMTSRSEIP